MFASSVTTLLVQLRGTPERLLVPRGSVGSLCRPREQASVQRGESEVLASRTGPSTNTKRVPRRSS